MSSPDPTPGATRWHALDGAESLKSGQMRHFKPLGMRLLVGRTQAGEWFALENSCPHEGYPLSQGELKGCELTCMWHNWKFDVRDGACLLGGEAVRSFPVRRRAEAVEVDLAQLDPALTIDRARASLQRALFEHDNGRAIRDVIRLLQADYDPWLVLGDVARHDARCAEYGTTHTLAVAADCGRFLCRKNGPEAAYAIAPALDMCGQANRRLPVRDVPAALEHPLEQIGAGIRVAVEEQDAERAVGLLRHGVRAGADRTQVAGWLFGPLSDHFLDFGHRLIYWVKAHELLEHLPDDYVEDVYAALLRSIAYGTREDTLPYMRAYAERLAEVAPELGEVYARLRQGVAFRPAEVRDAVLDGRPLEAFDAVWDALRAGVAAREVAALLVGSAAQRLMRFDVAVDARADVQETWLWATHRLTYASAVRRTLERVDHPDVLRLLFHAVMFIHSGRPMDLSEAQRRPLPSAASGASIDDVLAGIVRRDVDSTLAAARACLAQGRFHELRVALEEFALADPGVRPIVVTHVIKLVVVACEEYLTLEGHAERELPLLATLRFLASPIVERSLHASVSTSLGWVVEGKIPRKLTQ